MSLFLVACALPAGAQWTRAEQMDLAPSSDLSCMQKVTDEDSYRLVRLSDSEIVAREELKKRSEKNLMVWLRTASDGGYRAAITETDKEADAMVVDMMENHRFALNRKDEGGFLMEHASAEGKDDEGKPARFEMRGNFLLVVNYHVMKCSGGGNEMDSYSFRMDGFSTH